MSIIAGESLFHAVSRVLRGSGPLSYYQYKALDSFMEIIALHDRVALLLGEEGDANYVESYVWLVDAVHEKTDCKIDIIYPRHRRQYLTAQTMARFEQICREIYLRPLGITSEDLFSKQSKDRTAEDMSERIEQVFVSDYPGLDCRKFAEGVYEISQKNASSSELLYFFRAHLFQAMAELQDLTPAYENQRLMAAIIQQRCLGGRRAGTLPYTIYKMADSLFIKAYDSLPDDKMSYPRASVLMQAMVEKAVTRSEILDSIIGLREELEDFRESYRDAGKALGDTNKSLYERAAIQTSLEESAREIWVPVIASLGRNYTPSKVLKVAKGVFGRYGVGELRLSHEQKKDSGGGKATYSTPSLIGIVTALAQSASEAYKDSKLIKPNRPLLDLLLRVARLTETKRNLSSLLPVRGFDRRLPRLIDALLLEGLEGVPR